MNSFNKLVLIASVLLAVGAEEKGLSSQHDESSFRFPPFLKGFFCSVICPERVYLKGNTLLCFVFNEGEYYRFVGRNTIVKSWRFFKVDKTSDADSLCRTALTGDRFFWNQTDVTCSAKESDMATRQLYVDSTTNIPESSTLDDSSSDSKRFSLKEVIDGINHEIAKLFKPKPEPEAEKTAAEGAPAEGAPAEAAPAEAAPAEAAPAEAAPAEAPPAAEAAPEAARRASHRSTHHHASTHHSLAESTRSDDVTPMGDFCHLILTDVCRDHKIIYCPEEKYCCWALIRPEACQGQTQVKDEDCYRHLGVVMSAAQA